MHALLRLCDVFELLQVTRAHLTPRLHLGLSTQRTVVNQSAFELARASQRAGKAKTSMLSWRRRKGLKTGWPAALNHIEMLSGFFI